MGRVNNNLDELEEDINSIEFQEDDMKALREEEQKHKVKKTRSASLSRPSHFISLIT